MAIHIRTSDRVMYRRCRRRWMWGSSFGLNLEGLGVASPLWLGTGIHFALEDFHSYCQYGHPHIALLAYTEACKRMEREEKVHKLPDDLNEQLELGRSMCDYYLHWTKRRPKFDTLWLNGVPQVEVNYLIPLPVKGPEGEEVYYEGTFDRIALDEHGMLWIVEYKTAKQFSTGHFLTDPQCNAYCWAADALYDYPIAGVLYQQHLKAIPQYPKLLRSTGRFSVDKRQHTTHRLYRDALRKMYGDVNSAPSDNIVFLNWLLEQEDEEQDRFIRRDRVGRNDHAIGMEGQKIVLEAQEMLSPNTAMYNNPQRDCVFQCPFYSPCVSFDDGGDWEEELESITKKRTNDYDAWRKYLPDADGMKDIYPEEVEELNNG